MDKRVWSSRRLAFLAVMAAFCFVGRQVTAALPNIQPVTAILMMLTLQLTLADGIIVAALTILISNIFLGMGPWTIYQILTYSILMAGLYGLRPLYRSLASKPKIRLILFSLVAFLFGFLYGFVISFFSAQTYSVSNFWAYYLQGLPFDLLHAFGNTLFYLILEPIISPLIQVLRKQYNF